MARTSTHIASVRWASEGSPPSQLLSRLVEVGPIAPLAWGWMSVTAMQSVRSSGSEEAEAANVASSVRFMAVRPSSGSDRYSARRDEKGRGAAGEGEKRREI